MNRTFLRLLTALAIVVAASAVPVGTAWSAPATRLAALDGAGVPGGQAVEFPTSHVGARWAGDDDAVVQVRGATPTGWSAWHSLPVAHDLEDPARGQVYSGLVRLDGATRLESRVVHGTVRGLRLFAIDTVHGPRRLVTAPPPAASAAPAPTRVPQPGVVTRAEWGADESRRAPRPPSFAPLTKLVVHHTATTNDDPDPAATVRAVYSFHTQVRGFDDIGYNFLVDGAGRIYEGRWARQYMPGEIPTGEDEHGNGVVGAHAEGVNTGSAGVALLGDFTSRSPTGAAVNSLTAMLAWKAERHNIDPLGSSPFTRVSDGATLSFPNISGHRDTRATSCPGDLLYARLPDLRQTLAARTAVVRPTVVGYWVAGGDGVVREFGDAPFLGDVRALPLNSALRGIVATPRTQPGGPGGYWLLGGDGGIFAFGDARFFGSTGSLRLNQPIVGMAATPTGAGYWLVARDGGVFAFGDAGFHGSTGAIRLNQPVVGMAPTPTGRGYWLVASDGGIFAFGDARFLGSTGAIRLNSPVIAMDVSPSGGYWLVARDGGVFAFGVPFHGSVPGLRLPSYAGSAALGATPTGAGYYILGGDGGMFSFGDARFFGATPGLSGRSAAVDVAVATALTPAA